MACCYVCDQAFNDTIHKPMTITPCQHVMCEPCIKAWKQTNSNCPECRKPIKSLTINDNLLKLIELRKQDQANGEANGEANDEAKFESGPQIDKPLVSRTNKIKSNEFISDKCEYAIYVIDNSGSMSGSGGKTFDKKDNGSIKSNRATRWQEASHKIELIANYNISRNITAAYYLLNPSKHSNWVDNIDCVIINPLIDSKDEISKKLKTLNEVLLHSRNIRNGTPLHTVTSMISNHLKDNNEVGSPICLNIVTDGDPDSKSSFEQQLKSLINKYEIFLVINLCTDSDSTIEYYNDLDRSLGNDLSGLDVIDDFEGELQEIAQYKNDFFVYSYDMHICRMAGCFSLITDLMDEQRLPKHFCIQLCHQLCKISNNNNKRNNDIPDYNIDQERYMQFLNEVVMKQEKVYNYRTKKSEPIVNIEKVRKIINEKSTFSRYNSNNSNNNSSGCCKIL